MEILLLLVELEPVVGGRHVVTYGHGHEMKNNVLGKKQGNVFVGVFMVVGQRKEN